MERKVIVNRTGNLAQVFINRPQKLNCLDLEVWEELGRVARELQGDQELRAVILSGAGNKAFCAGIDLNLLSKVDREFLIKNLDYLQTIHSWWENLEVPVIVAINGACIGGGLQLALCGDLRIASSTATFSIPEVQFGIIPDLGGTYRLTGLIGASRAKWLILTGDTISAEEALKIGLVDLVVPPGELMDKAGELASRIASRAPLAVRCAKKAINAAREGTQATGYLFEQAANQFLINTYDKAEGVKSFFEKRKADYQGR